MVECNKEAEALKKLRALMVENEIDAFVLFHDDSHMSEYIAPCDERIAFISGFCGSNAACVVTQEEALMWTDSRYWLAAAKELHAGWTFMKMGPDPAWFVWVADKLKDAESKVIGWDWSQYDVSRFDVRKKHFDEKGVTIKSVDNLVDLVWTDRPARPLKDVFIHELQYAGQSVFEKYDNVAKKMEGVDFLLLTALDEVAWLLNLRGSDIDYNPVFFSYLIFNVKEKSSTLFIEASKVQWIGKYLEEHKVTVSPYEDIESALSELAKAGKKVAADLTKCNARLHPIIKDNFEDKQKCVDLLKACKNKTE